MFRHLITRGKRSPAPDCAAALEAWTGPRQKPVGSAVEVGVGDSVHGHAHVGGLRAGAGGECVELCSNNPLAVFLTLLDLPWMTP